MAECILLDCYSETTFGEYEDFDKSDNTLIFVTLKQGLSSHKPWMKNVDNFSESPPYYCNDHT